MIVALYIARAIIAGSLIVFGLLVACAANPPRYAWRQLLVGLGMTAAGLTVAFLP